MRLLFFISILWINSLILNAQFKTEHLTVSGPIDLTINLGKYQIGTAIHITTQISGNWAEDGGIYHIFSQRLKPCRKIHQRTQTSP